jgi:hypothetical protein
MMAVAHVAGRQYMRPPGQADGQGPARKGTRMKQAALIVIGGLVALVGIVWTLQGLGYVGGSFMSGATLWAIIGPIVVLAGLAIVALGLRGRRRVRR